MIKFSGNTILGDMSVSTDPGSSDLNILVPIFSETGRVGTYVLSGNSAYAEAKAEFGEPNETLYGHMYDVVLKHLSNGGSATVIKLPNIDF